MQLSDDVVNKSSDRQTREAGRVRRVRESTSQDGLSLARPNRGQVFDKGAEDDRDEASEARPTCKPWTRAQLCVSRLALPRGAQAPDQVVWHHPPRLSLWLSFRVPWTRSTPLCRLSRFFEFGGSRSDGPGFGGWRSDRARCWGRGHGALGGETADIGTSDGMGNQLRSLGVLQRTTCMALGSVSGWNREHDDARLGGREEEGWCWTRGLDRGALSKGRVWVGNCEMSAARSRNYCGAWIANWPGKVGVEAIKFVDLATADRDDNIRDKR